MPSDADVIHDINVHRWIFGSPQFRRTGDGIVRLQTAEWTSYSIKVYGRLSNLIAENPGQWRLITKTWAIDLYDLGDIWSATVEDQSLGMWSRLQLVIERFVWNYETRRWTPDDYV